MSKNKRDENNEEAEFYKGFGTSFIQDNLK